MVSVHDVDVHDDAALQAWYDVETASVTHDRPDASHRTHASLAARVRNPRSNARDVLLAATLDDVVVGVADLTLPSGDNAHAVELEIHVHPEHRRRGVGRALWAAAQAVGKREGRTTYLGEAFVPPSFSVAFARALGFATVHEEDHLVLDLPHAVEAGPTPGYQILTWVGACPDDLLDAYVALRNQMEADVPTGEVALAATVHTPASIRESETRSARSHQRITAVAREEASGELAGYSYVFVPNESTEVVQDDTLVMPAHRGRRLGHALKAATLAIIARDHPDRTRIHTWTDPDNAPMQATNAAFGFRPVERLHEVQRVE